MQRPGSPHSKKRTPPGTHGSTQIFLPVPTEVTPPSQIRKEPIAAGQVHPTARSELLLALMGQRKSSPAPTEVTPLAHFGKSRCVKARFTPQQEANASRHSLVNANLFPAPTGVTQPTQNGKPVSSRARFTPQQEANASRHSWVNANLLLLPPKLLHRPFRERPASPQLVLVRGTPNAERPLLSRTFNHLQPNPSKCGKLVKPQAKNPK